MIRIAQPDIDEQAESLVLGVLRSGHIAQGPMVERFEALCAEMAGTTSAVAVSNGTVSLEASLTALGIGPGDEVVTAPFTFAATLNAILSVGATAVFADITDDFTVDPDAIAAAVTSNTAALLPVHLYGLPADMPALMTIADRHGLAVLEDAAQAHGATVDGRRAGGFGIGSFSFYATKNVTAGEGGVITTSDDELAAKLRQLRNQGMARRYEYAMVGRNMRMTDLQAAVAVPQLERLADINGRRNDNAKGLTQHLQDVEGLKLPRGAEGRSSAWHQYTVLLPERIDRMAVADEMQRRGVATGVYYPTLVWDHPPYRDNPLVRISDTPIALDASRRCLSLPVHQGLSAQDVAQVAEALAGALQAQ